MLIARWETKRRLYALLLMLPMLSLILAIWACGFTYTPRVGYRPPPVTHKPASQLRLEIQITGQYSQYGDRPITLVHVRIFEVSNSNEVSLADNASLTCNGTDINSSSDNLGRSCPQQPPGGAYRIVYTDEHGAATTVVVPVFLGTFAILSPQAGAAVPIPTNGALTIRYTAPTPPKNGSVAVDSVSAACSISPAQPCGAVYASLRPSATPTPNGPAIATPTENRGPATPTPGGSGASLRVASHELATPMPGPTPKPSPGATNTTNPPAPGATPRPTFATPTLATPAPTVSVAKSVAKNVDPGTILLTGDYSMFQPAKGFLSMSVEAHVTPDPGDFAAVSVSYSDILHTTFTWTR